MGSQSHTKQHTGATLRFESDTASEDESNGDKPRTLATLRASLQPKLLSGEIRVKEKI